MEMNPNEIVHGEEAFVEIEHDEGIEYDEQGRMKYHPEFHPNHGKRFSIEELEYMCKFYEYDSVRTMALALGRTEATIASKVRELRQAGKFEYYKNLNMFW
ncbi:DNA-entry nuclease [Brevibacillus dissolubilis]|uniref:DNA-entry nuclease n=1 Tax=Brevibacillus dissolubilis TaxID=1844116 RepID=UPI0021003124|nr:DNA-entry nuclease [Brevibacillus dissolubilis]